MGNVYKYGECDHCRKRTSHEYSFIVHRDPTPITRMEELGYPVGKIAAHFCGYCGNYVDIMNQEKLTPETCACGHFQYQGWNYEKDDPNKWDENPGWDEDEDEDEDEESQEIEEADTAVNLLTQPK